MKFKRRVGEEMEDPQAILADNVKYYRQLKGWTQERLAEASRLSLGAIQMLESKKRWPNPDTLVTVAGALGVQPYILLAPRGEVVRVEPDVFESWKRVGDWIEKHGKVANVTFTTQLPLSPAKNGKKSNKKR